MSSRVEVRSMTEAQLSSFREAFTKSEEIGAKSVIDNRGFAYWAGLHGLPGGYCEHSTLLFLPWHRAYLYMFEKSLQDHVSGVTLPWWDWTSEDSHAEGIPASYTYPAASNPLRNAPVSLTPDVIDRVRQNPLMAGVFSDGPDPVTLRYPGGADELPDATTIDWILNLEDFRDFSTYLEGEHGGVHAWVGGSMSQVAVAGFDPVFWAHHSMIDRLWYLWQMKHPSVSPFASQLNQALAPFPLTIAQVLDIGELGYDYAVASIT